MNHGAHPNIHTTFDKGQWCAAAAVLVFRHGLRTPDFFNNIPNFWANWTDRLNKFWGIFVQIIGTHFCNCYSLDHDFHHSVVHKMIFRHMILAENNLGNSHHVSVFCVSRCLSFPRVFIQLPGEVCRLADQQYRPAFEGRQS